MNQPDLSLTNTYIRILQQQTKFKAKVIYALGCICNCISISNPNKNANLFYITTKLQLLIQICSHYVDATIIQLVVYILNPIRSLGFIQVPMKIMRIIRSHNYQNITDGFITQVCRMIDKCRKDSEQSSLLAYDILKKYGKYIGVKQSTYLTQFLQKYSKDFSYEQTSILLNTQNLSQKYLIDLVFDHWINKTITDDKAINFIDQNIIKQSQNYQIVYSYLQISMAIHSKSQIQKKIRPQYICQFYNSKCKPLYLLSSSENNNNNRNNKRIIISEKNNKIPLDSASQNIVKILQYYGQQYPNYLELTPTKNAQNLYKKYQTLTMLQQLLKNKKISAVYQNKFIKILPISLLDITECIILKLEQSRSPNQALQAIMKQINKTNTNNTNINNTNKKNILQLCRIVQSIYLRNKQNQSLTAVKFILQKQQITIEDITKSNNSYLILLPILHNSYEYLSDRTILKKIQNFFVSQKQPHQQKFYLCYWALKNKNQQLVQNFIRYFFREIRQNPKILDELLYYLKKKQDIDIDVIIKWLLQHFHDDLQRILQQILTMLQNQHTHAPIDIIFELNKFQGYTVFDTWLNIYRWALVPLDSPDFQDPELILDYLQVFQTLVQGHNNAPVKIIEKYCQIIIHHWQMYTHHHIFSIERTLGYLYSGIIDKPTLIQQVIKGIGNLKSKKQSFNVFALSSLALGTLLSYVLDHDCQKNQADLDVKIVQYLSVPSVQFFWKISLKDTTQQQQQLNDQRLQYLQALELFMWRFQYSDNLISSKIHQNILQILKYRNQIKKMWRTRYTELIQNCLEIISTMNHSANLLTLPIRQILLEFRTNTIIVTYCLDIIESVIEANPKALVKFHFQQYIQQCIIGLICLKNYQFQLLYIDILDRLFLTQGSPHYLDKKYINLFLQVLHSQVTLPECRYHPRLIQFTLSTIKMIGSPEIDKYHRQINWILHKYHQDPDIVNICKQIGFNKTKFIKSSNQSLPPKVQMQKQQILQQQQQKISFNIQLKQLSKQQPIHKKQNILQNVLQNQRKQQQQQNNRLKQKQKQLKQTIIVNKSEIIQSINQKSPINNQINNSNNKQIKKKSELPLTIIETTITNSPTKQQNIKKYQQSPTRRNKNKAKQMQTNQHISTIKQYNLLYDNLLKYILKDKKLPLPSQQQFRQSLQLLSETVRTHYYYCQKVVNLGIVSKTLTINQSIDSGKKYIKQLLQFYLAIAQHKQKNLPVFTDKSTLVLFYQLLEESVKRSQPTKNNSIVILILKNSWSLTAIKKYQQAGLWTILIEMTRLRINQIDILNLLISIEISIQLLNQIYQRKILPTLIWALQSLGANTQQKIQLCLWIRLAGKICINQQTRQKIFKAKIHQQALSKINYCQDLNKVSDLTQFYANLCYQYQPFNQWCIKNNVVEIFIKQLQKMMTRSQQVDDQFYKFFHYYSLGGQKYVNSLFQLNYHKTVIRVLKWNMQLSENNKTKHLYKSLSLLFIENRYSFFLKEQTFMMLFRDFLYKHSSYIMEAVLKLVECLQTKEDCQEIIKQGLQQTDKVFDSKIKDDESYEYVLRIYVSMLQKFGNFNPQYFNISLVYRILRKGVYSINVSGKSMVINFLMVLSKIDKIYYGNGNCVRIFESIMNCHTDIPELKQLLEYLQIQQNFPSPPRKPLELDREKERYPMRFMKVIEIPNSSILYILITRITEQDQKCNPKDQNQYGKAVQTTLLITQILVHFSKFEANATRIYNNLGRQLQTLKPNSCFKCSARLLILSKIVKIQQIQKLIQLNQAQYYDVLQKAINYAHQQNDTQEENKQFLLNLSSLLNTTLNKSQMINQKKRTAIINLIKTKKLDEHQCIKSAILFKKARITSSNLEIQHGLKDTMKQGIKVKLYKEDSSISELILHFTNDLKQINCVIKLGEPVKPKWRIIVAQIINIVQYSDKTQFKGQPFTLSSGLFSKMPEAIYCLTVNSQTRRFHICFESEHKKSEWAQLIKIAMLNSAKKS